MTEHLEPAGGRHPRLVVLSTLVAVVVLGILGMHALQAQAGHAGMEARAGAGMGAASHGDDVAVSVGSDSVTVSAPALTPSMPGMAMLCAFMLLGVGLALLLARYGRRVGAALHRVPPTVVVAVRETARRATGPPFVWDFSVVRC